MSLIYKESSDFRTYAYHENDFIFVSKEDILGKWSVFFYPADQRQRSEAMYYM